jgi:hypothetical protein
MEVWEGMAAPPAGKALVVFLRPSAYGSIIKSSVYDISAGQEIFIGIVAYKDKVAYVADPGERLFMVVGENVDFMDAKLEADKTYHVLVSPRMGAWKARFSLRPVRNDAAAEYNLKSADFAEWQQKTRWVRRTTVADAWYAEHQSDIAKKKAEYMKKWHERSAVDKAGLFLHAEDGV